MKNNLLYPDDIHLINLDSDNNVFLHVPTLQMYPLNKENNDIYEFLQFFKKNGSDNYLGQYDSKQFKKYLDFINKKISTAPQTVCFENDSKGKEFFSNIVLPISAHCNLNCPYCFAQTDGGFNFSDYTETDIKNIVHFIVNKNEPKTPINLIFFGGEPLMKFDIIQFTINHCKEAYPDRQFGYSMTTNGTILNGKILSFIKENNITLLVSLDGPDNEFNLRKFKDGSKSIDKVVENLKGLQKSGIHLQIRATLLNNNPYICETFNFFENLGILFNVVFAYASENKSHHYADYDSTNLLSIAKQFDDLFDYYAAKIKNKETLLNRLLFENIDLLRYRLTREVSCGAGMSYFTIMSNGDIFSCPHFMNNPEYCIGNIRDGKLHKGNFIPAPLSQIDECTNCWAKQLCLGGCLSQKIYMGKSSTSSQTKEECELNRIAWTFYIKMYYYIMQNAPGYFVKSEDSKDPCKN